MNSRILGRTLGIVTITLALATPAAAQTARVVGVIDDYATAAGVPWQLAGEWSATLKATGTVDIVVSVSMKRPDPASPGAHTHHIALTDGTVSVITGGYRISGTASITSNGAAAGFSGSPVTFDVTGGAVVSLAKVGLTFGGAAVGHFGDQPIEGVVVLR
jgi:hypothetical protein